MVNSDVARILTQWNVDHNTCYTATKMGTVTVTGGSGSTETVTVRLLNTILHAEVFQIINIPI